MRRQQNRTGLVWNLVVDSWTTANIVMPKIQQAMHITPSKARRTQNRKAINSVSPPRIKEQRHNAFR